MKDWLIFSLRRITPVLATLGLVACFCGITLWAIFQGLLLPRNLSKPAIVANLAQEIPIWKTVFYYLAWTGLAALAAIVHRDLETALISFLAAYVLGAALTWYALALPGMVQSDPAFREILVGAAVNWTFVAYFPLQIFLGLVGTIAGVAAGEMLLRS